MKTCAPSSDTARASGQRRISSFVARGRVSPAQRRDFCELVPRYAPDFAASARDAGRLVLDLGFGSGESLIHAAQNEPDKVFWGVEMHIAGLAKAARDIQAHGLRRVHLVGRDAMELLQGLPDAGACDIRLWFPDPWPKRRHHKRRLVQGAFLRQVARVLVPGGCLRMASDDEGYALQMLTLGNHSAGLRNCNASGGFVPRCPLRPLTRYERRGLELGHRVYDLCYRKPGGPTAA